MTLDLLSLIEIGFVSGIGSAIATLAVEALHDRAKRHLRGATP